LHRVSFPSFLSPLFKSNDDQISATPLTLSFNITKFHKSQSDQQIATSLYCLLLHPTCMPSSRRHKFILNETFTIETINLTPIGYYLFLLCTMASIESENLQYLRSEETVCFFLRITLREQDFPRTLSQTCLLHFCLYLFLLMKEKDTLQGFVVPHKRWLKSLTLNWEIYYNHFTLYHTAIKIILLSFHLPRFFLYLLFIELL